MASKLGIWRTIHRKNDFKQCKQLSCSHFCITGRVCSEVDSVMAIVKTRVHDAFLTAMDRLVNYREVLVIKSVSMLCGRDIDNVLPDPEHRYFSKYIGGLDMTARVE